MKILMSENEEGKTSPVIKTPNVVRHGHVDETSMFSPKVPHPCRLTGRQLCIDELPQSLQILTV